MAQSQLLRFCPIVVGRNAELASGADLLRAATQGHGGVLLLSGDAGVGKSRLMRALVDDAERQEFRVIGGVCQEQDRDYPFAPFLDSLRQQVYSQEGAHLADLLGPERAVLARLLPELDSAPADAPLPPLPPEHEKRRIFEAFAALFARLAHDAPLLITLEDLHWADETSIELLRLLPRRLTAARVLIVVTARSDEPASGLAPWLAMSERDPSVVHLPLAPLTQAEVEQMIAAMVGAPVPDAVTSAIHDRAEGNPFVVEELVHAIASDLVQERRTGTAWRSVTARYVPASMAETVARRLERLSPEARAVAACAAVIGRRFPFDLLRQSIAQDEATVLGALRELVAAHLVIEAATDGTYQFAFRHALTRDAIDNRLIGPERRQLHRQVARALTTATGAAASPSAGDIGHHAFMAEDWELALTYCRRAGEQAQALYAPHAAIEHFSRALVAATRLGAPTATIVLQRAQAYEWIGELERALGEYESVLTRAHASGDRTTEWLALTRLTQLWGSRDHRRGMAYCEAAIALARTMKDRASLGRNLIQIGAFEALYGEPSDARTHLEEARAIFQSLNEPHGHADALEYLGIAAVTGADLVQAVAYFRRATDLFRILEDRRGLIRCLVEITQRGATLHGDWLAPETARILDAAREGEEAIALARESGWPYGESYSQSFSALCVGAAGDYARALPWAEHALKIGEETGLSSHAFVGHGTLGILYLELLALPAALRHLERALALAREIGSLHYIQDTIGFTVTAFLANGEPERAAALLGDALPPDTPARTIAQRRIWLARAELALAQGEPEMALRIVDDQIASLPNFEAVKGRGIPRLSRLRGEAFTALGRYAEAETVLSLAAKTAQAQGARPLLWRIHLALGTLYRSLGRMAEAGQAFATVREIVEEIALTVPDARLRNTFVRKATALIPGIYPLKAGATPKRSQDGLTTRERAIVTAVAHGQSNREIADTLFISEKTAEWHVSNCLRKRGFRTRAELAAWAVATGLASSPPTSREDTAF